MARGDRVLYRWTWTLLALALLLACSGCAGTNQPAGSAPDPTTEPSATGPTAAMRRIPTGDAPCSLVASGQSVWVSHLGSEDVTELDTDGQVIRSVPVPGSPCWMAADATGGIWISPTSEAYVVRLDPSSGMLGVPVVVTDVPADSKLAFGHGSVWATVAARGEVVRIDPVEERVLTRIATGSDARGLLVTADLVWVANAGAGSLTAVDPARDEVIRRLDVPRITDLVASTSEGLWVATAASREVLLVDPVTGEVLRRHSVGGNPQPGIVVGDEIWVPNHLENTVSIISGTDRSVRAVPVGSYPSALLAVGPDVWVAAFGDGSVVIVPDVVP